MNYVTRPTEKGNYTTQDLRVYALYRKKQAIDGIETIFHDKKVMSGGMSPHEHEEYREPLGIDKEYVIEIQLSTGGDADGYKLTFNEHSECISGVYYWADWGVYEEVRLTDDELELVDQLYAISEKITAR